MNNGDELLYCPRMECNRNSLSSRPFKSLKALRVHFQQRKFTFPTILPCELLMYFTDYSCREVCVHCHKSFLIARAYIRHVQSHGQITGRNGMHIDATRQELIKLSNDELDNALYSKKRKRVQVARTAPTLLNRVDESVEQPALGTEVPSIVSPVENAEILAAQQLSLPSCYSTIQSELATGPDPTGCYPSIGDVTAFAAPLMREYSFPLFDDMLQG